MINELVERYLNGEKELFEQILKRFQNGINSSVQRRINAGQTFGTMDKKDMIQELEILLYRALDMYNPNQGVQFNTYYWNAVTNKWKELSKRSSRQMRNQKAESIEKIQAEIENFDIKDEQEVTDIEYSDLEITIIEHKKLSEQEKRYCMLLLNGLTNTQIAEVMNISRQRVSKIAKNIREKCNCNPNELLFNY